MPRPLIVKIAFVVLLLVGLAVGVLIGMSQRSISQYSGSRENQKVMATIEPSRQNIPTPLPSPSPEPPKPTVTEWPSPNGKSILVMKKTVKNGDAAQSGSATFSFFVKTEANPVEHLVFSKSLDPESALYIPFNSWSPDNKHFYVQEKTGSVIKTFVFNASGEPFSGGEPLLDVDTLFAAKDVGFDLKEVTGWAAPTLLIVNSKTPDDQNGPSYWFDITRKSVTRLSTSFQ